MAAVSATVFAQAALVDQNIDKAYGMLDPDLQAHGSKEDFSRIITTMNKPTAPKMITATDFEPIPGQDGMNIYLTGETDTETFYYRIPMKGSEEKGYRVAGVFRNEGPYPKSSLRRPF
jgi:hypothetical protein